MSWDVNDPAGSALANTLDTIIKQFKADMQTALRGNTTEGLEAIFPGSDAANPIFRYRGLKGTTAQRPTASQGGLYLNTTTQTLQRSNGTTWEDIGRIGGSYASSSSCGNFSTSSTTYVDVTNLSVTITTVGRPVLILLVGDGTTNDFRYGPFDNDAPATSGIAGYLKLVRDSTSLNEHSIELYATPDPSNVLISRISSAIVNIDVPAAGTYVYKFQARCDSG